jgi:putative transposase
VYSVLLFPEHLFSFQSVERIPHLPKDEFPGEAQTLDKTMLCYGYRPIRVMLLRDATRVSKNLVYRLHREEGLAFRTGLRLRRLAPVQR